ncbi:MAG TPA: glycosyltransferase family 39 protein [Candidatus Dormibacteraeota bacterium]|nr:glycosyltransferase family 39 protein [Candidatus Dormibacteraeota bacterium]
MEKPVRAAFIGAAVGALATLPGLGAGTLWDNSETAYGEVAREILLRHDWIVMHLNGQPWFVQPPLYFWIAAAFAHVFGATAFALRLPSALASVAMAGVIAYVLAREAGERAGILGGIILSSALMQAVIGRLAIMDAVLDLAVMTALLMWFRGLETGKDRYYLYGTVAAALGFLAKGPVAPVVALLVILPYAYWSRADVRVPRARAWVLCVAAFLAIVAPWFVALACRAGGASVLVLIGHYTFGRYAGVIENQSGPVWYYVPVLILGFFPWIAFLAPAIAYGTGEARRNRLWRLSFVWIVVPLLFFSFAQTKLPNYVALELPGLAIVTALYFDAVARRGATRWAVVAAAVVPVTIGLFAIAIRLFSHENRLTSAVASAVPPLVGAAAAIFLGSLVTAVLLVRRSTISAAPYALAAATLAAIDVLAVAVLPHAEAFKPVPRLAAVIDRERRPGDVVAIQDVSGSNALVFYTQPGVVMLASPGAPRLRGAREPRRVICGASRVWVVAPRARPVFDPTYGRSRREVAAAAKTALFLYSGARCAPLGAALRFRR